MLTPPSLMIVRGKRVLAGGLEWDQASPPGGSTSNGVAIGGVASLSGSRDPGLIWPSTSRQLVPERIASGAG